MAVGGQETKARYLKVSMRVQDKGEKERKSSYPPSANAITRSRRHHTVYSTTHPTLALPRQTYIEDAFSGFSNSFHRFSTSWSLASFKTLKRAYPAEVSKSRSMVVGLRWREGYCACCCWGWDDGALGGCRLLRLAGTHRKEQGLRKHCVVV